MAPLRRPSVRRRWVAFLILLTLFFSFGCFREFYRANQKSEEAFRQVVRDEYSLKYFIVHAGSVSYHLYDIVLTPETISGSLEALPPSRMMYETTIPGKSNRYRGGSEKHVLDEVHIWLRNDLDLQTAFLQDRAVTLRSKDLDRIEFYEMSHGATTASHVLGVVLIAAGVGGVVLYILSVKAFSSALSGLSFSAD